MYGKKSVKGELDLSKQGKIFFSSPEMAKAFCLHLQANGFRHGNGRPAEKVTGDVVGVAWTVEDKKGLYRTTTERRVFVNYHGQNILQEYLNAQYPWDQAPQWAEWAAIDLDECASWYQEKPIMGRIKWENLTGTICNEILEDKVIPSPLGWVYSLQSRPKNLKK